MTTAEHTARLADLEAQAPTGGDAMSASTITEITCDMDPADQLAVRDELMNLTPTAPAVAESTDGTLVAITDGYRAMTAAEAIRAIEAKAAHYAR